MSTKTENVAIIPARGGSKRIPKKNILNFCDKPIIAYSIQAAIDSKLFSRIIVSTDSEEITAVAKEYGAEVPFARPRELSNDLAPTAPVIAHAVEELGRLGKRPDFACCIYPCAPLIDVGDLEKSYELLIESQADFIYPVTEYPHPIFRSMTRDGQGKVSFVFPEYEMTRTQDLPAAYHDAAQFYWGAAAAWIGGKRMHTGGISLVIPHWRVVDIDNLDDWKRAEFLYKYVKAASNTHHD